MQGDKLIIDENHKRAGKQVANILLESIQKSSKPFVITVAGESGSGKSETAECIAYSLKEHNITSFIFQQDDYFIHPPKTNEETRKKDINWVGMNEVKLDLLDQEIQNIWNGPGNI